MSLPDNTAIAALYQPVIKPVFFVFLDINGDPVRCNTSGADITPSGTGDADLDGKTFLGIDGSFVSITSVKYGSGGSDSVTAVLSGIPGLDDDTLATIGTVTNWRGRSAAIWRVIRNAANLQQGGYHRYYTGKMTGLSHSGDPDQGQTIKVTIESYLAAFSQASNRTYLDQERYDAGDLSAKAAVAIANGNFSGPLVQQTPTYPNFGGGFRNFEGWQW